jgi:mRNA-degrading endonuclease RelE of RelBE toxin-antitoxin system
MYAVSYQREAAAELRAFRAFDRVRILEAIARNLRPSPTSTRGRRKRLDLGGGDFIWQLRIGDYRVFYDVLEEERLVIVRHVRRKGRKTTGEIL